MTKINIKLWVSIEVWISKLKTWFEFILSTLIKEAHWEVDFIFLQISVILLT